MFSRESFIDSGKSAALADLTSESLIIPQLKSRDMIGAIQELSAALGASDPRWNAPHLCAAALEREKLTSTAMDFGAAFPHVRSSECWKLQFALGRAAEPFAWGPAGATKVRLVFFSAVPANDPMGYLKFLSGLARLGKDATILELFHLGATARDLLDLLTTIPLRK